MARWLAWILEWILPPHPDFDYYGASAYDSFLFQLLPRDVQRIIISDLMRDRKTVLSISLVCKEWRAMFDRHLHVTQQRMKRDPSFLCDKMARFILNCVRQENLSESVLVAVPTIFIQTTGGRIFVQKDSYQWRTEAFSLTPRVWSYNYTPATTVSLTRERALEAMKEHILRHDITEIKFPFKICHNDRTTWIQNENHPLLYLAQHCGVDGANVVLSQQQLEDFFLKDVAFYKRARMLYFSVPGV